MVNCCERSYAMIQKVIGKEPLFLKFEYQHKDSNIMNQSNTINSAKNYVIELVDIPIIDIAYPHFIRSIRSSSKHNQLHFRKQKKKEQSFVYPINRIQKHLEK